MRIDMDTEATPPKHGAGHQSEDDDYSTDKNEEEKQDDQEDEDSAEVAQIVPLQQNHRKFTRPIEESDNEEAQDSEYSSINDLKLKGQDGESPYMGTEETADLKDRVDKSDLDENASY